MKRFLLVPYIILSFCCSIGPAFGQELNGLFNAYAKVLEIESDRTQFQVDSSIPFATCDWILCIQMQGASVEDNPTSPAYGDILDYGAAGRFEWHLIRKVIGDTIHTHDPLGQGFTADGSLQIVRVPRFQHITVNEPIIGQAWNGETGGVIALIADQSVELQADILADSLGFASLGQNNGGGDCTVNGLSYPPVMDLGAFKGAGIAVPNSNLYCGRGHYSNGGGGGNSHNGGGGGGGNGGAGGLGGDEWESCFQGVPIGGQGGSALQNSDNRLFLGGAGGNGHQNNNLGTVGSRGGGIVILSSPVLISNGFTISANGQPIVEITGNDGAGGGGAGGSVLLDVDTLIGNLMVSANGADGGRMGDDNCHGPGGGGGGGRAYFKNNTVENATQISLKGGEAGRVVNNQAGFCFPGVWGAENGADGFSVVQSPPKIPTQPAGPPLVIFGPDSLCVGQESLFSVDSIAGYNFRWYLSGELVEEGNQFSLEDSLAGRAHSLWVEGKNNQCEATIAATSFLVKFPPNEVNFGPDTVLCNGETLSLSLLDTLATSYIWNTGESSPAIVVSKPGFYWGTATNYCGSNSDEILVSLNSCPGSCEVWSPNAINPNSSSALNQGFQLSSSCAILHQKMQVFNRWGQLIYEGEGEAPTWTGLYKGIKVPQGIYTWRAKLRLVNGYGVIQDQVVSGLCTVL